MTTRKTELLVGIFVLLTIAATLLLALKVANQGLSGNEHSYTLYAKFDNIGVTTAFSGKSWRCNNWTRQSYFFRP